MAIGNSRRPSHTAAVPIHDFRPDTLNLFVDLSKSGPFATEAAVPLNIVLPAFITSELKTAFEIGFLIFLPFLVIDMVIASILMSLGMMMLSLNCVYIRTFLPLNVIKTLLQISKRSIDKTVIVIRHEL